MVGDQAMLRVIAGLGYRRGCAAEALTQVVRDASAQAGCAVHALAAPAFKADEPGLREAADALALPLILVPRGALHGAQGRCLTRSETVRAATGLASVAEACALAAAGEQSRLILPRIAHAGATCALAEDVSS